MVSSQRPNGLQSCGILPSNSDKSRRCSTNARQTPLLPIIHIVIAALSGDITTCRGGRWRCIVIPREVSMVTKFSAAVRK